MKSFIIPALFCLPFFAHSQTSDTTFAFTDSLKLTFRRTQVAGQTIFCLDKANLQMTLIELQYLIKNDSLHQDIKRLHAKGEKYCDSILGQKELRIETEMKYHKQIKKQMVELQDISETYKEKLTSCTQDLDNCNKDLKKERSWFVSKFMTYLKGALIGAAAGVVVGVVIAKQ